MSRGGLRAGAGRRAGTRNKRTEEQEKAVKASGLTPLEFLTSVYQDESEDKAKRIDAAKAAAPYCHARLSTVELSAPGGGPIQTENKTTLDLEKLSDDQLRALASIRIPTE